MRAALQGFPTQALADSRTTLWQAILNIRSGNRAATETLFNHFLKNYHAALQQTADPQLLQHFQNNLARLAALKAEHLASDVRKLAKLSQSEFNTQARVLLNTYNRYQAAEYNTFVHRARVANQFAIFQKERHLYPNVQWLRTRSANPRDLHLSYVGRIWALDDPFLLSNHPGCLWGCKCSWRTTADAPTDNSGIEPVTAAPGLEGNPFFTKEIVSNKHPYYNGLPKHIARNACLTLDKETALLTATTANGNTFRFHYNAIAEPEWEINRPTVEVLATNNLKNIVVLPQIKQNEVKLREKWFGVQYNNRYPAANPDLLIDGEAFKIKHTTLKNLIRNINRAAAQAENVVIVLKSQYNPEWATRICNKARRANPEIKKIILVVGETIRYF